jgi:hypothetical protein
MIKDAGRNVRRQNGRELGVGICIKVQRERFPSAAQYSNVTTSHYTGSIRNLLVNIKKRFSLKPRAFLKSSPTSMRLSRRLACREPPSIVAAVSTKNYFAVILRTAATGSGVNDRSSYSQLAT